MIARSLARANLLVAEAAEQTMLGSLCCCNRSLAKVSISSLGLLRGLVSLLSELTNKLWNDIYRQAPRQLSYGIQQYEFRCRNGQGGVVANKGVILHKWCEGTCDKEYRLRDAESQGVAKSLPAKDDNQDVKCQHYCYDVGCGAQQTTLNANACHNKCA